MPYLILPNRCHGLRVGKKIELLSLGSRAPLGAVLRKNRITQERIAPITLPGVKIRRPGVKHPEEESDRFQFRPTRAMSSFEGGAFSPSPKGAIIWPKWTIAGKPNR